MKNKEKEILEKVKMKIAISNFEEREGAMGKHITKKIGKVIGIAACLIVSITGVICAANYDKIEKFFKWNPSSGGVNTAVEHGYIANVEPTYQSAEGIEISVDSFVIDDFNFVMRFIVTLDDRYNIDDFMSVWLDDLRIVDEQNNVVFSTVYYTKQNENGEYESDYSNGYNMNSNKLSDNQFDIILNTSADNTTFPKSKKLYVTFTKILDHRDKYENVIDRVYEGNWKFELDVPKEMYERKIQTYKATKCSEQGIDISSIKATLSNTAFKISIPIIETDKVDYELLKTDNPESIFDKIAIQKEYIETSDGKRFEPSGISDGEGGYSILKGESKVTNYHQTFNLTSFDATEKLTVHMFTNKGEEITIEFER